MPKTLPPQPPLTQLRNPLYTDNHYYFSYSMEVQRILTAPNVALQRMICSVVLESALAAQKSLLSLLFMSEFLCLYLDLLGVERRFPFVELKRATAPDNETKDSSETEDDDDDGGEDDENTDDDDDDDDDEYSDEGSDDDEEASDGDDAGANGNGGRDDDSDDEDDETDDEDDEEDDDEDDEEEENQPPYKKKK